MVDLLARALGQGGLEGLAERRHGRPIRLTVACILVVCACGTLDRRLHTPLVYAIAPNTA